MIRRGRPLEVSAIPLFESDVIWRLGPGKPVHNWMRAGDKHPTRCLPLTLATALGWELAPTVGCTALWDGGAGKDSLKIKAEKPGVWKSMFGRGILSAHTGWLFRLPPKAPEALLLRGAPNLPIPGLHPLEGLIEAGLEAPVVTAAMSWQLEPDRVVSIPAGLPLVFLVPVQPDWLGRCQGTLRPPTRPEWTEYRIWAESREQFNKQIEAGTAKKRWQKVYARAARRTRFSMQEFRARNRSKTSKKGPQGLRDI